MDKFEFEGEEYYFSKGQFYDSMFMSVEKSAADRLAEAYFAAVDYKALSADKLLEYIKQVKDAGRCCLQRTLAFSDLKNSAGTEAL